MRIPVIILVVIFFLLSKTAAAVVYPDPQYINFHKTTTGGDAANTCFYWYNHLVSSISEQAIDEIKAKLCNDSPTATCQYNTTSSCQLGTTNRKLGFSYSVDYLQWSDGYLPTLVNRLLQVAQNRQTPIFLKLDGFVWWEYRPDLWNWWDPNLTIPVAAPPGVLAWNTNNSGYNPDNKNNVEWTGWDSNLAVKIGWRNWGSQIRVRPHPNLGSQRYINEKLHKLSIIIPVILNWYNTLPADQKYLLAGVELDNELTIGWQYYYYPNGNNLLTQNPANDPNIPADWSQLDGGYQQVGYATLSSYGIKTSGTITATDLNTAITRHYKTLSDHVVSLGYPRNKLFSHGVGQPFSYSNMLIKSAAPGWSFYDYAYNPAAAPGLTTALSLLDNTNWGAVEWLYMGQNGQTVTAWQNAINSTINLDNNKMVTILNWEGVSNNQNALTAVRNSVNQSPSCWLNPANISQTVSGNTVTFTWEAVNPQPGANFGVYLNVSNSPEIVESGGLRYYNNVHDEAVTNLTSKVLTLPPGTYYWQIVVDGCPVNNLATQRRITPGTFTILSPTPSPSSSPSPTPTPSPSFTFAQLKTLLTNYLSTSDTIYKPIDNKVNMLDAGHVIRWVN